MRFKGTLTEWNDDRGFGFIEPAEGGSRVFCHIKAFEVRVRRPMAGDRVTYEVVKGEDGRTRAEHVRPAGLEEAGYQSNVGTRRPREGVVTSTSKSWIRGWAIALLLGVAGFNALQYLSRHHLVPGASATDESSTMDSQSDSALLHAFNQHQSNVQVQGSGVVERVLPDDSEGSRHQRFIVRLASGHTILIAHNIDLAPRVASLSAGDKIEFSGEYEWNDKGGVVHWTHRDPQGHHQSGWIKHGGSTYQ